MYQAMLGAARTLDHSDFSLKATGAWAFLSHAYDMVRDSRNNRKP